MGGERGKEKRGKEKGEEEEKGNERLSTTPSSVDTIRRGKEGGGSRNRGVGTFNLLG